MPIKEYNVQHCLLSSDRKLCIDGLKMTVIVLPDPILWFGTSEVVYLFLLTESHWKVTSYAPKCEAQKYLSCQRKRSESLGPAARGSAGQRAFFNSNANAFLAACFWDFTSASVLVVDSQHFIQLLSNKYLNWSLTGWIINFSFVKIWLICSRWRQLLMKAISVPACTWRQMLDPTCIRHLVLFQWHMAASWPYQEVILTAA